VAACCTRGSFSLNAGREALPHPPPSTAFYLPPSPPFLPSLPPCLPLAQLPPGPWPSLTRPFLSPLRQMKLTQLALTRQGKAGAGFAGAGRCGSKGNQSPPSSSLLLPSLLCFTSSLPPLHFFPPSSSLLPSLLFTSSLPPLHFFPPSSFLLPSLLFTSSLPPLSFFPPSSSLLPSLLFTSSLPPFLLPSLPLHFFPPSSSLLPSLLFTLFPPSASNPRCLSPAREEATVRGLGWRRARQGSAGAWCLPRTGAVHPRYT